MDKYHREDVIGIERENERDENYKSKVNPQIDHARTPDNYHVLKTESSYIMRINARIKELAPKRKIKDDAVLMCSFILGSDKEFFDGLSTQQMHEFFHDVTDFFEERYGTENILSAVVHLDETTPHMHLNLIPVFEGRLCAKRLFDKVELRSLQTDFHERIGKKWGLKRGEIGSKAEHLETAAFKLKKMKEEAVTAVMQQSKARATITEAEQAQKAAEPIKALLYDYEKAKTEKIPFSGKKKDEQIIALRTENEQLKREIEIRGRDQSDLFKQLQEAKNVDSRKETAYKIITDMMSAYPDEFDALLKKSRDKKTGGTPTPHSSKNQWAK